MKQVSPKKTVAVLRQPFENDTGNTDYTFSIDDTEGAKRTNYEQLGGDIATFKEVRCSIED